MKKLFLIIFLLGLFYFPQVILATPTPTPTPIGGVTLWKYQSEKTITHIKKDRGIIIPNGTTDIKTIYVYFHGNNSPTVDNMCAGTYHLCKDGEGLNNTAILIPTTDNIGSSNKDNLTKTEIDDFINEATNIIKEQIHLNITENNYVVMGHSGGGSFVSKFLEAGYTAQTTILFDACYGWCTSSIAPRSNSGHIYYYYQGEGSTKTDSTAAYNSNPAKSTLIKTTAGHNAVVDACFADHLTPNNCAGTAIITSQPTEPTVATKPISQASYDEVKDIINQPDVKINIPGLKFTDKETVAKTLYETEKGLFMNIPYLGEYISALYKYLIAIAGVLAVVMIIKYGFDLAISGGESEKINNAKKRIGEILIGLLIAAFSYVLLYTINPNFVSLKSLQIRYVEKIPLFGPGEDESQTQKSSNPQPSYVDTSKITASGQCFPIKQAGLSSISWNWGDMRSSGNRCHAGIDLFTKSPGEIVALDDGIVRNVQEGFITCKDGWGLKNSGKTEGKTDAILIYHEKLKATILYGEIDNRTAKVKKDDKVTKGQLLGIASYCGMLHLETYKGEQNKNEQWFPPKGENSGKMGQNKCAKNYLSAITGNLLNPEGLIKQIQNNFCN